MKISGILKFGAPVLMMAALVACDGKKDAEVAVEEPVAAPMEQPMAVEGAPAADGAVQGEAPATGETPAPAGTEAGG
ncbi:MAG: hypothetical protein HZA24_03745 [Nitrospirae bacterium]|nr:hypothetical protein [Nitrospirota bacterium]